MRVFQALALATSAGVVFAESINESTLNVSWERRSSAAFLPGDLCGLSIEYDRFPDWAGNYTHRNEFTYALLDTLKKKTGVAPRIRVGGGTQDRGIFTPDVVGDPGYLNYYPPVPDDYKTTKQIFPEADYEALGPNFWLGSCNFPRGTEFSWGVNLRAANASEAAVQTREIEEAFAHPRCRGVKLNNIAIGNEPDTWTGNYRPDNWNISAYVDEQIEFFNVIEAAIHNRRRRYRAADFAIHWTTTQLIEAGIMETPMGSFINMVSEHHYQTSSGYSLDPSKWPTLAAELTNKTNVRSNLAPYRDSAVAARAAGLSFVLGETNTFSGHGQPGVSNSAAAALWVIDYSLQAACLGVTGLDFHQGVGYNYSAFEPINNVGINITDWDDSAKRHVLPLYYGYVAVADAIGTSGNAYVEEVETNLDNIAAYQIWEGKKLKRIMLINSASWTKQSSGTRPTSSVNISGLAKRRIARFKTLEFPSLSATSGLTWGGQDWENSDGSVSGRETFEPVDSTGTIALKASSAVLVYV